MSDEGRVIFDSSVWIEIFRTGPLTNTCKKILASREMLGVPSVVIFEVYKKIAGALSEDAALSTISYLKTFPILDLTTEVALTAADLALTNKLAMADSFVLAHAHVLGASLITLDNDFAGIIGAEVLRKR